MKSSGLRAPDTRRILLICLSFASIAAAIWFLVLEHVRREQAIAIAVASRDNENMAIALEQYASRVFEAQDLAAMHVAERFKDIPSAGPTKPLPLPLVDPIASNPLFRAVLVTDRLGNVRYTNLPDAPPLNVSSRPTFKFLSSAERPGPVISRPGISPINGDALYSLSRAIRRPDGSFGGTVIVQMKVARLTAFNERARTGAAAVRGRSLGWCRSRPPRGNKRDVRRSSAECAGHAAAASGAVWQLPSEWSSRRRPTALQSPPAQRLSGVRLHRGRGS